MIPSMRQPRQSVPATATWRKPPPLFQTRLRISSPGDRCEREAEQMADTLAHRGAALVSNTPPTQRLTPTPSSRPLAAVLSNGVPLPDDVRGYFEPHFGHDFSQVRVHADATAA